MNDKTCTKCEKSYPATSEFFGFYTSGSLRSQCRQCRRDVVNGIRAANPKPNIARSQAWRQANPARNVWEMMLYRCTNPESNRWRWYGGANPPVIVCNRWLGEQGYENFCEDMGPRPPGTTLGRWGDVGAYSKENCSWQTQEQQEFEKQVKNWNKKLEQIHNFNAAKAA